MPRPTKAQRLQRARRSHEQTVRELLLEGYALISRGIYPEEIARELREREVSIPPDWLL
jgi:hypothetical protein